MKPLLAPQQKYLTSLPPGRLKYLHTARKLDQSGPVVLEGCFSFSLSYCHRAPLAVVLMHVSDSLQSALWFNLEEFGSLVKTHLNFLCLNGRPRLLVSLCSSFCSRQGHMHRVNHGKSEMSET